MFKNTLNNMGYQAHILDEYSLDFIKIAAELGKKKQWCLEIGCAFGACAHEAIKNGANVTCNDLDPRHLQMLKESIGPELQAHLQLLPGDFLKIDIAESTFGAIFCSRVLHFLNGDEVMTTLAKMHRSLVQNGKVIITVETPFLGNWKQFQSAYINNKKARNLWPGLIENAQDIEDSGRAKHLPKLMHFFDIDTLARAVTESDFSIDKISYIDREKGFPKDILLDGRESIGVIATKL